ncbi:hypothetical protein [Pyrinomonas methylaliphatogenes]|uniref:hypothetical protein n=1 Tax=Pyrinomonas methylaliphatogenes TaxID=454194 RepID=UPI0012FD5105|nr:hypothetical protein [Pyrinomonas methylaliphatogenes]MBX5477635.1 hypothetical protein [Pyrinomonas methylaliphatogenes]
MDHNLSSDIKVGRQSVVTICRPFKSSPQRPDCFVRQWKGWNRNEKILAHFFEDFFAADFFAADFFAVAFLAPLEPDDFLAAVFVDFLLAFFAVGIRCLFSLDLSLTALDHKMMCFF